MKRMNLIVDEELLEQALKATGERTYSAVINRGLKEIVRQKNMNAIFELEPGWWEGDLGAMRGDSPYAPPAPIDVKKLRENAKKIKAELLEELARPASLVADRPMSAAEEAAYKRGIKRRRRS